MPTSNCGQEYDAPKWYSFLDPGSLSLLPHLGLCHMSSQGILGDSGIVVAQCHCDVTR